MKKAFAVLGISVLMGIAKTVSTLSSRGAAQRQVVDPDFPEHLSEFADAWGRPLEFVVDDPAQHNVGRPGLEDMIFIDSFLLDCVLWTMPCLVFVSAVAICGILIRRKRTANQRIHGTG